MLPPIVALINMIIELYSFVIFVYIVIQLLIYFEIVNKFQPFVAKVMQVLSSITEPVFNKIRKYLKPINGVDISPLVLLLTLHFIQYCLAYYFS